MNQQILEQALQTEGPLPEELGPLLETAIQKAPYAAVFRALYARWAHDQQDSRFSELLTQAAIQVPSRAKLREWIEGPLLFSFSIEPTKTEELEEESARSESKIADAITEASFSEDQAESSPSETFEDAVPDLTEMQVLPEEAWESEPKILDKEEEVPTSHVPIDSQDPAPKEENRFGFGFVRVKAPKKATTSKGPKDQLDARPYHLGEQDQPKNRSRKKPEDQLIERFLQKTPTIGSSRIEFGSSGEAEDLSRASVQLDQEIVTENMAYIYLKQKNTAKALDTFRKLQLKFPEKSDYFAALIKNLENQV